MESSISAVSNSSQRPLALITGGSAGIGLELARQFAAGGYDLLLVARDNQRLAAAAEQLQSPQCRCHVLAIDLADAQSPQKVLDAVHAMQLQVDVLVNNAGFGTHGKFWENSLDVEAELVQVNITSLIRLTHLLLPTMVQRGRGRILNVASTAAFQPGPLMANYYASKAYVLSFSEALASELAGSGVTVTCLCPGPVATGFQKRAGINSSWLFAMAGLSAAEVARIGYHATMAGKRVAIAGWKNGLLAFGTRFVPTALLLRVARNLNESR